MRNAAQRAWKKLLDREEELRSFADRDSIDLDIANYHLRRTGNKLRLTDILAKASTILRDAALEEGADELLRWELRIWEPERIAISKTIQIIAVDPHGVGHSIVDLAR